MRTHRLIAIAIVIGVGVIAFLLVTWNPWSARPDPKDSASTSGPPAAKEGDPSGVDPTEIWDEIEDFKPAENAAASSVPQAGHHSQTERDVAAGPSSGSNPNRFTVRMGGSRAGSSSAGQGTANLPGPGSKPSVAPRPDEPARVSGVTDAAGDGPSSPSGRVHKVTKGETLSSIAKKYYGSEAQWKRIADANRQVLKNPSKLRVGMELIIPERGTRQTHAGAVEGLSPAMRRFEGSPTPSSPVSPPSSGPRQPAQSSMPEENSPAPVTAAGSGSPVSFPRGTTTAGLQSLQAGGPRSTLAGPGSPEPPKGDETSPLFAQDSTSENPAGQTRTYTMAPGDTLAMVSKRFYGTTQKWGQILEANRKVVKNPRTIRSGVTLVIP